MRVQWRSDTTRLSSNLSMCSRMAMKRSSGFLTRAKALRSVWRDWQEAEEFGTRWEELTAEEIERREIERERASRRLRRETSKFQSSTRTRRR